MNGRGVKVFVILAALWSAFWLLGLLAVRGPWYYIAVHAVSLFINGYVLYKLSRGTA